MNERDQLLGTLAEAIGGWNSSPQSLGRLEWSMPGITSNDGEVVRYMLECHKRHIERPLLQQITELKAKLYDLEHKES